MTTAHKPRGLAGGRRPGAKRAMDLALVCITLPLWLPLLALTALAVRLLLGQPVLFVQQRPGYMGRPFRLIKFRTMADMRDTTGQPLPDARRLTRFGRLLRSTSLDELPELWNVLRGEMSLVGPRPLLMEYLDLYSPDQARRHEAVPGVTGLAQVSGRNALPWPEVLRLDVWYVDNWSLWLDLRILARTIVQVPGGGKVNQPGSATREKFKGEQ